MELEILVISIHTTKIGGGKHQGMTRVKHNYKGGFEGVLRPKKKMTEIIDNLAKDVIAGKYGTGEVRKKALGDLYKQVQKRVNELLK